VTRLKKRRGDRGATLGLGRKIRKSQGGGEELERHDTQKEEHREEEGGRRH
jgi:hypothetical protein